MSSKESRETIEQIIPLPICDSQCTESCHKATMGHDDKFGNILHCNNCGKNQQRNADQQWLKDNNYVSLSGDEEGLVAEEAILEAVALVAYESFKQKTLGGLK